ncbi:transmembrane protein 214-B [Nematostella vectensis]|uniref:transmembrane protein 214-B n=1 Tax=Nematostella vectensis TaxID=45351 RepID=UPI00207732C3|nr:transmembrane protein 214-B [Nematostella vectensis]
MMLCEDGFVQEFKMASAGKWEVVGKGGKKRQHNDKKKEKFSSADAPKLDVASPVPEAETIYQAFDIHDKKQQNKNNHFDPYAEASNDNESQKNQEPKKTVIKKKAPPPKPPKPEQQQLEEALQKVELDQLRNILAKDQEAFPNNPSLWLKDLASYIHLHLQNVPERDPVFEDKPKDYPMCLLKKDVKGVLMNALKKSSETTLEIFFQYCMNEMVQEMSRGHSVYGLQLMIQCAVCSSPTLTVSKVDEYEDMLIGRKSRPKEALAIMWALGQLPNNNPTQGMAVWLRVMMPVLSTKQLAKYAISYLEDTLSLCDTRSLPRVLAAQDFLAIMHITFASNSPLTGNHSLQRKMLSMYPKLKAMTFASDPASCGQAYFLHLLALLGGEDLTVEHLTEVLDCLTYCLEKDAASFSLWVEHYPTTLNESSVLLYHIIDTWNTRANKVNKEKVHQAVTSFQVFNSLETSKGKQLPGLENCITACRVVEEKSQQSSCFSVRCLLKLLMLLLIAAVSYDVCRHGGYQGSKTARFAQEYGIEQGTIKAYGHVKHAFDKGNSWVQENYPTYYSKFREYADPAGQYAMDKLTLAGQFIEEQSRPARAYLNKKVPELLERVEKEAPVYWAIVHSHVMHWWNVVWPPTRYYLMIVWAFLHEHVPPLIANIQALVLDLAHKIYLLAPDFFNSVAASLESLGQKIVERFPDVVAVVQEYAVIASNLVMNLVNNVIAWLQSAAASNEDIPVTNQKPFPK